MLIIIIWMLQYFRSKLHILSLSKSYSFYKNEELWTLQEKSSEPGIWSLIHLSLPLSPFLIQTNMFTSSASVPHSTSNPAPLAIPKLSNTSISLAAMPIHQTLHRISPSHFQPPQQPTHFYFNITSALASHGYPIYLLKW